MSMMPPLAIEQLSDRLDLIDQLPIDEPGSPIKGPYYSIILGDMFDIETDDSGKDSAEDYMARCMLEAYVAIRDDHVYDLLRAGCDIGKDAYIMYVVGYNILQNRSILGYGVSIRGAWLEVGNDNKELFARLDVMMNRAVESWNETHDPDLAIGATYSKGE